MVGLISNKISRRTMIGVLLLIGLAISVYSLLAGDNGLYSQSR